MKYLAPILVIAALLMSYTKASPHDHSRPELNDWFKELRAGGSRAPCCDGSDAQSLEDPDWKTRTGR